MAITSACLILQVRAAVEALRNVRGLPWQTVKESHPRAGDLDCLDWLQDMFGFQVGLSSSLLCSRYGFRASSVLFQVTI